MNRGDIVRIELPQPRGMPGREQFGVRPAIVVQNEDEFANLSTVVVVPLTSNLAAANFEGAFRIRPTSENGLAVESVVLTQQVRAIDRNRIQDQIGVLGRDDLNQLNDELRRLLSL